MAGRQVTPALYVKPVGPVTLISAPTHAKHALMAEVARRERAGELRRLERSCGWNPGTGRWEIRVGRLAPAAPRWRRPAITAAVTLGLLGAVLAAGWWALLTLAALPGLVFLGLVLVAFVALVLAKVGGREPSVDVQVNVSVRR